MYWSLFCVISPHSVDWAQLRQSGRSQTHTACNKKQPKNAVLDLWLVVIFSEKECAEGRCPTRQRKFDMSNIVRPSEQYVVLGLLRSKCLPILLYATEACPLLARDKQSLEFTITRIFMKIFRTGSTEVVKNCQFNLFFCRFGHRLISALRNFYKNLLYQKIACAHYLRLVLHVNWVDWNCVRKLDTATHVLSGCVAVLLIKILFC